MQILSVIADEQAAKQNLPKESAERHSEEVINITFAAMASLFLIGLLFVSFKVFKVVGCKDKVLLSMLLCLNLELASKIVFYVANAYQDREVMPGEVYR